jgi:hypothetical protein
VRAGAEARIIISKWRADAGKSITFSDGTSQSGRQNSISIAGVAGHPAPSPTGAISTWAKAVADPDLPAPAIDLAGKKLCPPADLPDHRSRRQALGNNRPLVLGAPPTPPFRAGDDFNPRRRTISSTSANTVACTSAYQPDTPLLRKGGHYRTVTDQLNITQAQTEAVIETACWMTSGGKRKPRYGFEDIVMPLRLSQFGRSR